MNNRVSTVVFLFGIAGLCLYADDFHPMPSTNAIALSFDSRVSEAIRESIQVDFQRCLSASASEIELYHFDHDPTNRMSLAGFWQPYGCLAATSRLGSDLPEDGILSNGAFTIDVSYSFATNYQRHIETTAAYSNEIAAAYAFIEALSPTNLNIMSTNELLSLDLWKEVAPGGCPAQYADSIIRNRRKTRYYAPPRHAFFTWDCGPTNNASHLWCHIPVVNTIGQREVVSFDMMIYFQNRWWFSTWLFQQGVQQW